MNLNVALVQGVPGHCRCSGCSPRGTQPYLQVDLDWSVDASYSGSRTRRVSVPLRHPFAATFRVSMTAPSLTERAQALFDWMKSAPSQPNGWVRLEPERVDDSAAAGGTPLEADQHYFQVRINELYL